jgi:hypothetical protein
MERSKEVWWERWLIRVGNPGLISLAASWKVGIPGFNVGALTFGFALCAVWVGVLSSPTKLKLTWMQSQTSLCCTNAPTVPLQETWLIYSCHCSMHFRCILDQDIMAACQSQCSVRFDLTNTKKIIRIMTNFWLFSWIFDKFN